jgi:molybdopterin converting factor small subunit
VATVRIPAALRDYTDGATSLAVSGDTVAAALAELARAHPRLRRHLYTEQGALRNYVNVFVNADEIRTLADVHTPLAADDTLFIVPSIAGG